MLTWATSVSRISEAVGVKLQPAVSRYSSKSGAIRFYCSVEFLWQRLNLR